MKCDKILLLRCALESAGNMYISSRHAFGKFHHSSFLAGRDVAASGEIKTVNGKVAFVNRRSGHYQQDRTYLNQMVEELRASGVTLSETQIGDGF